MYWYHLELLKTKKCYCRPTPCRSTFAAVHVVYLFGHWREPVAKFRLSAASWKWTMPRAFLSLRISPDKCVQCFHVLTKEDWTKQYTSVNKLLASLVYNSDIQKFIVVRTLKKPLTTESLVSAQKRSNNASLTLTCKFCCTWSESLKYVNVPEQLKYCVMKYNMPSIYKLEIQSVIVILVFFISFFSQQWAWCTFIANGDK